jgi:hypothetical protein
MINLEMPHINLLNKIDVLSYVNQGNQGRKAGVGGPERVL